MECGRENGDAAQFPGGEGAAIIAPGRALDAKTILRWVTNPVEMLWQSAREQMARDSAAHAAGAKLQRTQAQKKAALAWLKTPEDDAFMKERVAQIRAAAPEMFAAAERVKEAGKTMSAFQKKHAIGRR